MIYKIRLILDTKEDVFRDIVISYNDNLEDLHNTIANAFGFEGNEMAAFYLTDNEWNQGEEIPLFDMEDTGGAMSMQNFTIKDVLPDVENKLIYVYDFFSMWTFYVELMAIEENTGQFELPSLLFSVGTVPDKAPEKEFKIERLDDGDSYDSFDNYDDFNFDDMIN